MTPPSIFSLFSLLLPLAFAANDTCPPSGSAHIIVARASDEAPGFGIIGNVSNSIVSQLPGSNQEAVIYPASFTNYFPSEQDGVSNMKSLITDFAKACPHSAIVCMGYSQGAQVTADALIGTDDKFIPSSGNSSVNGSLPQNVLNQVAAVVLMGDPSHIPGLSFDVGNSTNTGIFPRMNSNLFNTTGLAGKIQSYCDHNDTYCDSGSSSAVHDGYVQEYGVQAAKFVVGMVGAWTKNGTSSGSGSGSSTMSGSMPSGTAAASASGSGSGSQPGSTNAATPSSSASPATGDAIPAITGPASWNALFALVLAFALGLAL